MELKDYSKTQAHKSAKEKFTIAVCLLVGTSLIVTGAAKFARTPIKEDETTTSVTQIDDNEEDNELILSDDFDINNPEEVNKRANDIFAISDQSRKYQKAVSKEKIVDLLYLINGKYDAISYGNAKTDVEKFEYVRDLITRDLFQILNDNVEDEFNRSADLVDSKKELTKLEENQGYERAYYFMAGGEDKQYGFDIAKICIDQEENIEKCGVSSFADTEEELRAFLDKVSKDKDLNDAYALSVCLDAASKAGYWNKKEFSMGFLNSRSNALFAEWAKFMGFDYNEILEKLENCDIQKTKEGKQYNAADAVKAEQIAGNKAADKQRIEGGKEVATQSVTQNQPTTHVSTTQHKEPVTEGTTNIEHNGTTQRVEITTDANGNGHGEVVVPGGQPVTNNKGESTTQTVVSGGEVIDVVIEENGTTKHEVPSTTKKPNDDNTTTTTKKPNNDNTTTTTTQPTTVNDDDEIPEMDEDTYDKLKGAGSLAAGGFLNLVGFKKLFRRYSDDEQEELTLRK